MSQTILYVCIIDFQVFKMRNRKIPVSINEECISTYKYYIP